MSLIDVSPEGLSRYLLLDESTIMFHYSLLLLVVREVVDLDSLRKIAPSLRKMRKRQVRFENNLRLRKQQYFDETVLRPCPLFTTNCTAAS